jgi:hypothetical protein
LKGGKEMTKPRSIFRTREQILIAEQLGNVKIKDNVLVNPQFRNAEMNELLGFKILEGSDFTVIDVKSIKDNPQAFMEVAFGEVESNGTG